MTDTTQPDTTEQRLTLALDVLREFRRGAAHESCKHTDDDPDPCWHCCDWNQVVDRIDAVLQGETREHGYFDLLLGLQYLVKQSYEAGIREIAPFTTKERIEASWQASGVANRLSKMQSGLPDNLRP